MVDRQIGSLPSSLPDKPISILFTSAIVLQRFSFCASSRSLDLLSVWSALQISLSHTQPMLNANSLFN